VRILVVVLTCVVVLGCNSTSAGIRSRFATERGCPESDVDVEASGGTEYRASGCGQSTVYVCGHFAMSAKDVRSCSEEDARSPRRAQDREREVMPPADPRVPMP
jgi:hypothetical protein